MIHSRHNTSFEATKVCLSLDKFCAATNTCAEWHASQTVPEASCFGDGLVSLAGAVTSIIFVGIKHIFCRDKTGLLSRQKYACRDNVIGGSGHKNHFCRDKSIVGYKHNFCQNFCRDKHAFVTTKSVFCHSLDKIKFCRDKHVFVTTNTGFLLSRQTRVCRDKNVLSRQTYFCRDKNYTYGSSR